MVEFLKTLAIACIPAIITGIVTYIVARKNAASQISIIKEQPGPLPERIAASISTSNPTLETGFFEKVWWDFTVRVPAIRSLMACSV